MAPQTSGEPELAHVLFLDIVGCSKLPSDEQQIIIGRLQELVRASGEYQRAQQKEQVISLPTGDGMALVFFNKLDAAVLCAVEITRSIQSESLCQIRMGVHSGPVFVMEDINHKRNVSGAGINLAERVMSCGAAGHILLSEQAAESLRHLSAWRDKIQDLGECQVKDGWLRVWNLVDGPVGNPAIPQKSRRYALRRRRAIGAGVAALALVVTGSLAGAFWLGRGGKSAPANQEQSIAVLPFLDLSAEKNQEYFSEGLAEELLDALTKIPQLRVACRSSSFRFKGNEEPRTIGQKLNVATILEGSVRKQGNRVKISVQLIKALDGFHIWSQTYNRELNDIFAAQEEIAKSVALALKVTFLAKPGGQTANAEAFNAHLQGRYFYVRRGEANLRKAAGFFEQAVQLDPSYAKARLGLGWVRFSQASSGYIPEKEGFENARDAANQALALDPNGGEAHTLLGEIKREYDWNWTGADKEYKQALELEPGSATVIRGAANMAKTLGRLDEAIRLNIRAIQIDPLSPNGYHNAGIALYNAGRYDEAAARLNAELALAPENEFVHGMLCEVYLAQSRPREALAEAQKEKYLPIRLQGLAMAYHALGRKADADTNVAELLSKFQKDAPYLMAEVYAFRGEEDRAFEWLERAYQAHDSGLNELKGDPLLKSLERDSRYAPFLEKMGLPL